jgi:dimethylargininase
MLRHAIVREPGTNFAEGLTTSKLGPPSFHTALAQHNAYCRALARCGLTVITLQANLAFPDSTFVEDAAILLPEAAILTHPGAPSRAGEPATLREVLRGFYQQFYAIQPPGTLDGGDVCEADGHYLIRISERTNLTGAQQLAEILARLGHTSEFVEISNQAGILHLKSSLAYLGDNRMVVWDILMDLPALQRYERISVGPEEYYAADCVRVNDYVLYPTDFPVLQARLEKLGYRLALLEMSEFQKMDGGLSCISLRF